MRQTVLVPRRRTRSPASADPGPLLFDRIFRHRPLGQPVLVREDWAPPRNRRSANIFCTSCTKRTRSSARRSSSACSPATRPADCAVRLNTADGAVRWLNLKPSVSHDAGVIYILATDITVERLRRPATAGLEPDPRPGPTGGPGHRRRPARQPHRLHEFRVSNDSPDTWRNEAKGRSLHFLTGPKTDTEGPAELRRRPLPRGNASTRRSSTTARTDPSSGINSCFHRSSTARVKSPTSSPCSRISPTGNGSTRLSATTTGA